MNKILNEFIGPMDQEMLNVVVSQGFRKYYSSLFDSPELIKKLNKVELAYFAAKWPVVFELMLMDLNDKENQDKEYDCFEKISILDYLKFGVEFNSDEKYPVIPLVSLYRKNVFDAESIPLIEEGLKNIRYEFTSHIYKSVYAVISIGGFRIRFMDSYKGTIQYSTGNDGPCKLNIYSSEDSERATKMITHAINSPNYRSIVIFNLNNNHAQDIPFKNLLKKNRIMTYDVDSENTDRDIKYVVFYEKYGILNGFEYSKADLNLTPELVKPLGEKYKMIKGYINRLQSNVYKNNHFCDITLN